MTPLTLSGVELNVEMGHGREKAPFISNDTTLCPLTEQVRQLVADGTIKRTVEAIVEIAGS